MRCTDGLIFGMQAKRGRGMLDDVTDEIKKYYDVLDNISETSSLRTWFLWDLRRRIGWYSLFRSLL